jgi:hypothetical protein
LLTLAVKQAEVSESVKELTWEIHGIRGDATNSSVVHSSKAHVCEVVSLFEHTKSLDPDALPVKDLHRIYPDLVQVGESCDGKLQRAIFLKQLRSAGVGVWQNTDSFSHPSHLRIWVFTTDQGPDQVAASKLMQSELVDSPTDILIHHFCLAHVYHLVALKDI